MTETRTTAQLQHHLERLQRGDAAAREALLQCACDRLRRLTKKMLKDFPSVRRWEETADVQQDAAVRLWRALETSRPTSVRHFFRLAALQIRRELLDLARRHTGPEGTGAHHASVPAGEAESGREAPGYDKADSAAGPDQLALWSEFHAQVEQLPEEEKEVFDLLWYQGLPQAEAAAVLGISERTLKRRWQAARLRLHEAMHGEAPL
jgi:RNA polymerase sigma-70 factor (ECF subfamily)